MDNQEKDWWVINGIGYGLYFIIYYAILEIIGISLLLALILFFTFPFYAVYINNFYKFYTEEYERDS